VPERRRIALLSPAKALIFAENVIYIKKLNVITEPLPAGEPICFGNVPEEAVAEGA
jgi:hypothetical protein